MNKTSPQPPTVAGQVLPQGGRSLRTDRLKVPLSPGRGGFRG